MLAAKLDAFRKHIEFWKKAYENAEAGVPHVTVPTPQVALQHILDEANEAVP